MNLYTHTMAHNLAITSVYSKANEMLEPSNRVVYVVIRSIKMAWKSR